MKRRPIQDAYRYCPHCSARNAHVGSVPFRCPECHFVIFFGPVAAVGGLLTDEDRLLLVRRARQPGMGMWGLPGGFVDHEETAEQALRREVLEETGLRLSDCQYLMSSTNQYDYHGVVSPVIDFFFECPVDRTTEITLDEDELDEFLWVHPTAEHLDRMAFESNRIAIEHWLKSQRT